jgi:predicted phosphoadenosine phosphosulfate sulfurtransferase
MKENKSKEYLNTDVYTEAKKRINHVIDTFDTIAVNFSGGKDSLCVLKLVEEVYKERGIKEKINVNFFDEELIPDDVVNFVHSFYKSNNYNFHYFTIPLKSQKFILGKVIDYIQWDPNRKWIREKPDFGINGEPGKVYDEYTIDDYFGSFYKGKKATLTGIRADESLTRLAGCTGRREENYITNTRAQDICLAKPIYDWSVRDVFKYFYDNKIQYCVIYDMQSINKDNLRVSTPLHAESSKRFYKLKTLYPVFYQQIINVFPEMIVQDRYWNQLDRTTNIFEKYPHTWDGIIKYINDTLEGNQRRIAIQRVINAKNTRENLLRKGYSRNPFGGYPILYVFNKVIAGNFKRSIMPHKDPSYEMYMFEDLKKVDYENDKASN